jgi:hypothetical protein
MSKVKVLFLAADPLSADPRGDPDRPPCIAVIRDELQGDLQRLASQIAHTRIDVPSGSPIPRRPGETQAQFEARDRDRFAHEAERIFSLCQQLALDDGACASRRADLSRLEGMTRWFVERARAAIGEVRRHVLLYRDRLQGLAASEHDDSRGALARLHSRQAANALAGLWFEILENWLMLEPDAAAIEVVQGLLPQVLGGPSDDAPPLASAPEGWRYAARQRARLHEEKMVLDAEAAELALRPGRPTT